MKHECKWEDVTTPMDTKIGLRKYICYCGAENIIKYMVDNSCDATVLHVNPYRNGL